MKGARILVVTPSRRRYARVVSLRVAGSGGDCLLLHSAREALERYDDLQPDVLVVDHRRDPDGDLVRGIKLEKERYLTSVVKVYSTEAQVREPGGFRVRENEYLVEPFEILELFAVADAELERLSGDRRVLQRQVRFELGATEENAQKAHKFLDAILRRHLRSEEDAMALYAAVKEAIDNAVRHGHRGDAQKCMKVDALVDHRKITVIVADEGEGFDFESYLSRLDDQETFERAKRRILEEGGSGGLGILLMSKCADRIEYSGKGNILRLEKNL